MKIRDIEWWIVGLFGLTAFILALKGFNIVFSEGGVERNFLDLAFQSIKLFSTEFVDDFKSPLPWQLEVARWLAPGILLYTVVRTIYLFLRRELRSLFLKCFKGHIIVTSLNDRSRYLINDLLKNKKKVVVIAGFENPQKFDMIEKNGARIVNGEITDKGFLNNIAAYNAKYFVFIDDSDETNISSAIAVHEYLVENSKIKNHILFTHVADDLKLHELVQLKFFEEHMNKNKSSTECEIRIISLYERTARLLFNKYSPDIFMPVTSPDSDQLHIALFGSNALTQSVILRFARLGHYANILKVKISLFHEDDSVIKKLTQNFPYLTNFVELNSIEAPLNLFDCNEFKTLNDNHPFAAVYLLCNDDSLSSDILRKISNLQTESPLNVILTLNNPQGILNKWYTASEIKTINLIKFNLIENTFTKEAMISEQLDELAKIIHEDYLINLGDNRKEDKSTHREWKYLTADDKNQNRDQADHIFVKLRAMDCEPVELSATGREECDYESDANLIELLSKVEHNRWWANKGLAGWSYGKVANEKKKLHDNMIEYEKLSEKDKELDRNTIKNMRKLLQKSKLKIVKKK